MGVLTLAVAMAGCASGDDSFGGDDLFAGIENIDESAEKAGAAPNWADQDTNGVGTHRITGDFVNVRGDNLSQIRFVATAGEQLTLSYQTQEFNGFTYFESYFKGGANDGERGWVASDFLAHTALTVCNGNGINVRTGNTLGTVIGSVDSGTEAFVVSGVVRNTGAHRYFEVSAGGLRGFIATDFLCGNNGSDAAKLLDMHNSGQIVLWNQTFGRFDGADPLNNIRDAAAGQLAKTSCHGTAPCTRVAVDDRLLKAMVSLVRDFGFSYFVTSIVGASHSRNSFHYVGRAIDIGEVNGVFISGDSSTARAFMDACRALGAVEVLGPSNDANHQDHIHCSF